MNDRLGRKDVRPPVRLIAVGAVIIALSYALRGWGVGSFGEPTDIGGGFIVLLGGVIVLAGLISLVPALRGHPKTSMWWIVWPAGRLVLAFLAGSFVVALILGIAGSLLGFVVAPSVYSWGVLLVGLSAFGWNERRLHRYVVRARAGREGPGGDAAPDGSRV